MGIAAYGGPGPPAYPPPPAYYYYYPPAYPPYAYYPGYYYPTATPYPPPSYYGPPEHHTRQGIVYFRWAFMLQLFNFIMAFIVAVAAILLWRADQATNTELTYLLAILGLGAVSTVMGLIQFILMILGFLKLYAGRWEHGPLHEKNVRNAIILYIFSLVLPFIGTYVVIMAILGVLLTGGGTVSASLLLGMVLGIEAFAIGGAVLMAFVYKRIVEAFTFSERSTVKYAMALMILNPIISLILAALLLPSDLPATTANTTLSPALSIGGLAGLLAVLLFYRVYGRVLQRMDSGELGRGVVPEEGGPGQGTPYQPPGTSSYTSFPPARPPYG